MGSPVVTWMDVAYNGGIAEDVFGVPDEWYEQEPIEPEPEPCHCRACEYVASLPSDMQLLAAMVHVCESDGN